MNLAHLTHCVHQHGKNFARFILFIQRTQYGRFIIDRFLVLHSYGTMITGRAGFASLFQTTCLTRLLALSREARKAFRFQRTSKSGPHPFCERYNSSHVPRGLTSSASHDMTRILKIITLNNHISRWAWPGYFQSTQNFLRKPGKQQPDISLSPCQKRSTFCFHLLTSVHSSESSASAYLPRST